MSNKTFLQSKAWKDFRKKVFDKQNGLDIITKKKLRKGFIVHHLNTNIKERDYTDLSNIDDFIAINKSTHEIIHGIFRYYHNDKEVLTRYKRFLDKMEEYFNVVF